jgi:hypothetical protein
MACELRFGCWFRYRPPVPHTRHGGGFVASPATRRSSQTAGMRRRRTRPAPLPRSAFAGFRFPSDVIVLAVRWYLRFGLSYRDVEELPTERDVEVVSTHRDVKAARRFLQRAIGITKATPVEVVTDRAPVYPVGIQPWRRARAGHSRPEGAFGGFGPGLRT